MLGDVDGPKSISDRWKNQETCNNSLGLDAKFSGKIVSDFIWK